MNSEREERVLAILEENLGVRREELTPLALLMEDLCMDSLDRVEISMDLEEEFDPVAFSRLDAKKQAEILRSFDVKRIDEDEAESWRTVADVQATARKMARKIVIPLQGTVS